jgi:hypothetical protein
LNAVSETIDRFCFQTRPTAHLGEVEEVEMRAFDTVFLGTTCARRTAGLYFQWGGSNGEEEIFR